MTTYVIDRMPLPLKDGLYYFKEVGFLAMMAIFKSIQNECVFMVSRATSTMLEKYGIKCGYRVDKELELYPGDVAFVLRHKGPLQKIERFM